MLHVKLDEQRSGFRYLLHWVKGFQDTRVSKGGGAYN